MAFGLGTKLLTGKRCGGAALMFDEQVLMTIAPSVKLSEV
jgi:hypothetical protein